MQWEIWLPYPKYIYLFDKSPVENQFWQPPFSTPVDALLSLIGLCMTPCSGVPFYPLTDALLLLLGLLHPELSSSPAVMLFSLQWYSAIPCGLPWLFPYSPMGTPILLSPSLTGFRLNCSGSKQLNEESKRGKGKQKKSISNF